MNLRAVVQRQGFRWLGRFWPIDGLAGAGYFEEPERLGELSDIQVERLAEWAHRQFKQAGQAKLGRSVLVFLVEKYPAPLGQAAQARWACQQAEYWVSHLKGWADMQACMSLLKRYPDYSTAIPQAGCIGWPVKESYKQLRAHPEVYGELVRLAWETGLDDDLSYYEFLLDEMSEFRQLRTRPDLRELLVRTGGGHVRARLARDLEGPRLRAEIEWLHQQAPEYLPGLLEGLSSEQYASLSRDVWLSLLSASANEVRAQVLRQLGQSLPPEPDPA